MAEARSAQATLKAQGASAAVTESPALRGLVRFRHPHIRLLCGLDLCG